MKPVNSLAFYAHIVETIVLVHSHHSFFLYIFVPNGVVQLRSFVIVLHQTFATDFQNDVGF